MSDHFYDFEVKSIQGKPVSMEEYRGQTILVVNTATKCGLAPQFDGLENLYQKYKDDGLVVLGFPSNQFANQEPGNSESVEQTCRINFGVSFPLFEKIDVNGSDAHPLFKYLKRQLPGFLGGRIKWNFTKFLIDTEGNPVKRFAPTDKPEKIEKFIKEKLPERV